MTETAAATTCRVMIAAVDGTKMRQPRAPRRTSRPRRIGPDFRAALKAWDASYSVPTFARNWGAFRTERALYAAWWFIENASDDAPDRTDVFFKLREIVRAAQA
jgi:hypothetical protein